MCEKQFIFISPLSFKIYDIDFPFPDYVWINIWKWLMLSHCSQLIQDDHLRRNQISAAEKVFELLSPPRRNICNVSQEVGSLYNNNSPSMIAASTILYSVRRQHQWAICAWILHAEVKIKIQLSSFIPNFAPINSFFFRGMVQSACANQDFMQAAAKNHILGEFSWMV